MFTGSLGDVAPWRKNGTITEVKYAVNNLNRGTGTHIRKGFHVALYTHTLSPCLLRTELNPNISDLLSFITMLIIAMGFCKCI
jgi:hypothetical protein